MSATDGQPFSLGEFRSDEPCIDRPLGTIDEKAR